MGVGKEGGRGGRETVLETQGRAPLFPLSTKQMPHTYPYTTPTPTSPPFLPTGGWMTPSLGGGLGGGALTIGGMGRGQAIVPPLTLDVKEKGNEFEIAVDAPGMKKEGTL